MPEWMQSDLALRVGYVLVHSLWEGAAVCVLAGAILWMLRRGTAGARYAVAAAAMAGMVLAPVVTFWVLREGPRERPVAEVAAMAPGPLPIRSDVPNHMGEPAGGVALPVAHDVGTGGARAAEVPASLPRADIGRQPWLESSLRYGVLGWAVGVMVLSLWQLGGWIAVQRLRVIDTRRTSTQVEALLASLAVRLGVRVPVRVVESLRVEVPMLLGVWKPLILIPPALLLGLAPGQLEAILAHELAHIRRYDYLALLLQRVAETVLFYHPGVWWLGRRLRLEQEQCCDDLAVAVVGDRRKYAGALAAIEEIRLRVPRAAALAVTGSGARELMARIRRLLSVEVPPAPRRARVAGAAVVITTALLAALMLALATWQSAFAQATQPSFTLAADTTVITTPFHPDGTPDYIRALNDKRSQGVTPENNGFVLWLQVAGSEIRPVDHLWDAKTRDRMLQLCGAKRTPPGDILLLNYFDFIDSNPNSNPNPKPAEDVGGFDHINARHALWTSDQNPTLAAYLKKQEKFLAIVAEAAARPRWWCPYVSMDERTLQLATITLPANLGLKEAADSLCARATLRAGSGDFDGFLRDVRAVKQLARHVGGGGSMGENYLGVIIDSYGNEAIGAVAGSGVLTEAQCAVLARSLADLGSMPSFVECVDVTERYVQLDLMMRIASGEKFGLASAGTNSDQFTAVDRSAVDWDTVLRHVNGKFDQIVAALKEPSFGVMKKRLAVAEQPDPRWVEEGRGKDFDEFFKAFAKRAGESRADYTDRLTAGVTALFLRHPGGVEERIRSERLQSDMLTALIAAAGVKARTGQWPDRLDALVPAALKEVPKDIHSADEQTPVHYVVMNGRARVFSLGTTGRDDGRLNVGIQPPAASTTGTASAPATRAAASRPAGVVDGMLTVELKDTPSPIEGMLPPDLVITAKNAARNPIQWDFLNGELLVDGKVWPPFGPPHNGPVDYRWLSLPSGEQFTYTTRLPEDLWKDGRPMVLRWQVGDHLSNDVTLTWKPNPELKTKVLTALSKTSASVEVTQYLRGLQLIGREALVAGLKDVLSAQRQGFTGESYKEVVRSEALTTVRNLKLMELAPEVRTILQRGNNDELVMQALLSVRAFPGTIAAGDLAQYMEKDDPIFRRYLAGALGATKEDKENAVGMLHELLDREDARPGKFEEHAFVKIWASQSLGMLGDRSGIPVMIGMLSQEATKNFRGNVKMVLEQISGQTFKEDQQWIDWWKTQAGGAATGPARVVDGVETPSPIEGMLRDNHR